MRQIIYCPCGQPLHYSDPAKRLAVEEQISLLGADVPVRMGSRTWIVPRHFMALHPVNASEIPKLKFPEVISEAMLLPFLYDSGSARVSMVAPVYGDQIFSHTEEDGQIRHFYITKLMQMINRNPNNFEQGEFPIETDHVDFVREHRGIEQRHLDERMTGAFIEQPGIICLFPDTTQLIVDGHHRFVKRAELGKETMVFWMVEEPIWRKSLVRVPAQFETL